MLAQLRNRLGDTYRPLALALSSGILIAGGTVVVGPMILPLVVGAVAVPWLIRDPFRLYVLLLVTWPIGTLYVNVSLPAGIPDLRYERILAGLAVAAVVAAALTFRSRLPLPHATVVVFAAIQLAWYLFHAATQGVESTGLSIFINGAVLPVALYWLTQVFITDPERLRILLTVMVVGAVLVAFTGFYERIIGAVASPFPVDPGTAAGTRYLDVPRGRAAGVFGNPAIYGAVLSVALLAAMALVRQAPKHRVVVVGAAGLLAYGVLVSYTRSAWLSLLVALLVGHVVTIDFGRAVRHVASAVVVLAIAGAAFLPGLIGQSDVISGRVLETGNVTGRIERMVYSYELFLERPITGRGPGALDEELAVAFAHDGEGFLVSHNTFLTLLVDGGIVVFLTTAAVIARWLVSAVYVHNRTVAGSPARHVLAVMLGAIIAYVLSGMALELKFFAYFTSVTWVAGAALEMMRRIPRDSPSFARTADATRSSL